MFIDKVSNCKYLGHCIHDKLNDDDDMARQRKQIICDPPRQNEALLAGAQNALQTKTLFYSHFSENVFRI